MKPRNEVMALSFELALKIIGFSVVLTEKLKYIIGKLILKAGTSIGANVREAQSCECRKDIVHKLKISHKEAEETEYWVLLCEKAKSYPFSASELKTLLPSIQKLLSKKFSQEILIF